MMKAMIDKGAAMVQMNGKHMRRESESWENYQSESSDCIWQTGNVVTLKGGMERMGQDRWSPGDYRGGGGVKCKWEVMVRKSC
jgi:hypothetical protein